MARSFKGSELRRVLPQITALPPSAIFLRGELRVENIDEPFTIRTFYRLFQPQFDAAEFEFLKTDEERIDELIESKPVLPSK